MGLVEIVIITGIIIGYTYAGYDACGEDALYYFVNGITGFP